MATKVPQKRIVLLPSPDFEVMTSIWSYAEIKPGKATFTLLHDYADLKPAVGWKVECEKTYVITAVNGRVLECSEGSVP